MTRLIVGSSPISHPNKTENAMYHTYELISESDDIGYIEMYFHKLDEKSFEFFDYDITITEPGFQNEGGRDWLYDCLRLDDEMIELDEEFEVGVLYRRKYKVGHRNDKSHSIDYGVWEYDCVTWLDEEDKDFAAQVPLEDDDESTEYLGSPQIKWPKDW